MTAAGDSWLAEDTLRSVPSVDQHKKNGLWYSRTMQSAEKGNVEED